MHFFKRTNTRARSRAQSGRITTTLLKIALAAFIVVIPVRLFLVQPFVVSGDSMEPAFHSNDYLVVDQLSYRFESPKIGDVVVFRYPLDPSLYLIKRIAALPGETVVENTGQVVAEAGTQSADAPPEADATSSSVITLADDEYYVLGDNPSQSTDSRQWGPLQSKFIVGRVVLRLWPPAL